MRKIEELKRQIESYREVLSSVRRPYRSPQDEVAERLISRLLHETSHRLKVMEQGSVKIHREIDFGGSGALLSVGNHSSGGRNGLTRTGRSSQ